MLVLELFKLNRSVATDDEKTLELLGKDSLDQIEGLNELEKKLRVLGALRESEFLDEILEMLPINAIIEEVRRRLEKVDRASA